MQISQINGTKKAFAALTSVTLLRSTLYVYVVVQFYPWSKFPFLLFLGMVMYDNEFQTKENKI